MSACMECAHNGTTMVDNDHNNTAIVSTRLPPYRFAALPPITYTNIQDPVKDFQTRN